MLAGHSSSVGRSVHARLPIPVAVAGSWSGWFIGDESFSSAAPRAAKLFPFSIVAGMRAVQERNPRRDRIFPVTPLLFLLHPERGGGTEAPQAFRRGEHMGRVEFELFDPRSFFPWDGRSPVSYPMSDVPFPPRRTGENRKGMISAGPLYQGFRRSVWDSQTSRERIGDWGRPDVLQVPYNRWGA